MPENELVEKEWLNSRKQNYQIEKVRWSFIFPKMMTPDPEYHPSFQKEQEYVNGMAVFRCSAHAHFFVSMVLILMKPNW